MLPEPLCINATTVWIRGAQTCLKVCILVFTVYQEHSIISLVLQPLVFLCTHKSFVDTTTISGFKPPNKAETNCSDSPYSRIMSSKGQEKSTHLSTACGKRENKTDTIKQDPLVSGKLWCHISCVFSLKCHIFPEAQHNPELKDSILNRTCLTFLIPTIFTELTPDLSQ